MTISEQIVAKRKSLNLSQKELAEKLDVTDKTVSRWERGVSIPDVEMLKKLSIVINIDLNAVFSAIDVSINENEKIDYEAIKQFRISYIVAMICFVFASILFLILNKSQYPDTDIILQVLFPTFFILAILAILTGIIIFGIKIVGYTMIVKRKKFKRIYKKEIAVSCVVLTISFILIIISLIL